MRRGGRSRDGRGADARRGGTPRSARERRIRPVVTAKNQGASFIARYRAGRQADALRIFQEGRHVLGEELGLDPGPELRQLEAAILTQDRSLDATATDVRDAPRRTDDRSTL